MFRSFIFFTILFSLLLARESFCSDNRYAPIEEDYFSPSQFAESRAVTSSADDYNTIFTNSGTVGIGGVQERGGFTLVIPNASGAINSGMLKVLDASGREDSQNPKRTHDQRSLLEMSKQDSSYLNARVFPSLVFGRFQIGYLYQLYVNAYSTQNKTQQPSSYDPALTYNSTVTIYERQRSGGVLGFSLPYQDTGVSVGITSYYTSDTVVSNSYEVSEETLIPATAAYKNDRHKGAILSFDGGLFFEREKKGHKVSVGISAKNFHQQIISSTTKNRDFLLEELNVSAGLGYKFVFRKGFHLKTSFDLSHINDKRAQLADKMRIGIQLGIGSKSYAISNPLVLYLGSDFKSVSYGLSLNLIFFRLELASFMEPYKFDSKKRLNRRYAVNISTIM